MSSEQPSVLRTAARSGLGALALGGWLLSFGVGAQNQADPTAEPAPAPAPTSSTPAGGPSPAPANGVTTGVGGPAAGGAGMTQGDATAGTDAGTAQAAVPAGGPSPARTDASTTGGSAGGSVVTDPAAASSGGSPASGTAAGGSPAPAARVPATSGPNAPAARAPVLVHADDNETAFRRRSLLPLAQPLWSELTPRQQQLLQPFAEQWNSLPVEEKRAWKALAQRFPKLSAAERSHAVKRISEWAALTPEQRKIARQNFRLAQALPKDERVAQWEQYQALTEEQRRVLQNSGSTSNTAARHAGSRTGLAKEAAQPIADYARPNPQTVTGNVRPASTNPAPIRN